MAGTAPVHVTGGGVTRPAAGKVTGPGAELRREFRARAWRATLATAAEYDDRALELRRLRQAIHLLEKQRDVIEDLSSIHDDMQAFTQGLGLRRFHGYIPDEMPSVLWDADDVNESWKDFLELARATGAPFITMNTMQLEADDVDLLLSELRRSSLSREDDLETARQLRSLCRTDRLHPAGLSLPGRHVSLRAFHRVV